MTTLVHCLAPTVLNLARWHLPQRIGEEELALTVFETILRHLGRYSGREPLVRWALRLAIRTCLKQLRHDTVRSGLCLSDLSEPERAVIEQCAAAAGDLPGEQRQAARSLLNKLLARLRPDQRLVVRLLDLEGRTVEEVSRMSGWSVLRVKVKACRARYRVRRRLETLLGDLASEDRSPLPEGT